MQDVPHLKNPLGISQCVVRLEGQLAAQQLYVSCGENMQQFADLKQSARQMGVGPMHDPEVCDFSGGRAYWMSLADKSGKCVGLQAYRCDRMDINLGEWCANYMIGVYMRRSELMVPSHIRPPKGSIAERLNGTLVYHGELWVDRELKSRKVIDQFSRLGSLLVMLRWNPDAIWALTGFHMATRGYASRMGYPHIERGFLRWQWHSDNVEHVEYLAVAERDFLEQLVEESSEAEGLDIGLADAG